MIALGGGEVTGKGVGADRAGIPVRSAGAWGRALALCRLGWVGVLFPAAGVEQVVDVVLVEKVVLQVEDPQVVALFHRQVQLFGLLCGEHEHRDMTLVLPAVSEFMTQNGRCITLHGC